eukprot:UN23531
MIVIIGMILFQCIYLSVNYIHSHTSEPLMSRDCCFFCCKCWRERVGVTNCNNYLSLSVYVLRQFGLRGCFGSFWRLHLPLCFISTCMFLFPMLGSWLYKQVNSHSFQFIRT